jgi:Fic/DOC family protein
MPVSTSRWPRLVWTADHPRAVVSRASAAGHLHQLARGLYTPDADMTAVVVAEWTTILAREFPDAVIVDASARAFRPMGGRLLIDHPRRNALVLPGLVIDPREGPGPVDGDGKGPGGIFMSSVERGLLDNLAVANERLMPEKDVQRWVEDLLMARGVAHVNDIRDRARDLAPRIRRQGAFERLNAMVRAARATGPVRRDAGSSAARRPGIAVDPRRIERFTTLATFLTDQAPEIAPVSARFAERRTLLTFYESYFSNYIEGTEFTIDEAADIVFDGKIPAQRPEDAHDVLGTYRLATDPEYAAVTPGDAREFLALLEVRHAALMAARPDVGPGRLREVNVRAGGTVFPRWELVEGTLLDGFEIGSPLTDPFARGVYLHFLASEVHPFADGNGRLSRLTMNAELEAAGMARIIVPTGYREDYLGTLRAASGDGHFAGMVSAFRHVLRWTARMDFSSRETAEPLLEATNALVDPVTSVREGIKLLLP